MRTRHLLITLSLCACASFANAAKPFAELTDNDVELFISVRNISEIRMEWKDNPLRQSWEDPEVQAFFKPLTEGADDGEAASGFTEVMESEFGLTYDELFELFPGQMTLAFYNMSALMMGQADRPEAVAMAAFSGDEERMNELMKIQFERNAKAQKELNPEVEHEMVEETFMGETLYFDETFDGEKTYVEDGYALVDGIFILATPESRLRDAVEAIKAGADTALGESRIYQRSRETAGRGDFAIYINLDTLMPKFNTRLVEQAMAGGLAAFGVTAKSLENALALDAMEALYTNVDLVDDGILASGGLLYREKTGLLSLLTYTDGTLPQPGYVPEEAVSTSISLFDFSAMLANLEKLLIQASPNAGSLLDMQLQTMQTNTGVDFRSAILGNIGGEVVGLALLEPSNRSDELPAEAQELYVIEVKDALALEQALETLKDLAPPMKSLIQTQEYEGETIYTIQGQSDPHSPDGQARDFSYALTRSHLIVCAGPVGLMQRTLSAMATPGEGFWEQTEIEHLFKKIARPNAVGRSYMDLEQMVKPVLETLVLTGVFDEWSEELDVDSVPKILGAGLRIISEINEAPDGIYGRTLILQSEDAR